MKWPRVRPRSPRSDSQPGIYTDLDTLIRLQFSARGFTLRPRQPLHSILAGPKASKLRGRGLDFEELRGYLPGDDVRNIDWKATARLRKPHVRVYLEERDRPCLLLIDQRLTMFFGSREKMKSVAAAEAAALAAWRVLGEGDRVGAIIFNDTDLSAVQPRRSQSAVMRILRETERYNRRLRVDLDEPTDTNMLNAALQMASRTMKHDGLVVVISDFRGVDEQSRRLWTRIAAHNDTIAVHVSDPLERGLPRGPRLVFQRQRGQIEVDTSEAHLQKGYSEGFAKALEGARHFLRRVETPVLSLDTTGDVFSQVHAQLGQSGGQRS